MVNGPLQHTIKADCLAGIGIFIPWQHRKFSGKKCLQPLPKILGTAATAIDYPGGKIIVQ